MPAGPMLIQVTLFTSFRNQVANNVLHYSTLLGQAVEQDLSTLAAFATTFANQVIPDYKECLSQDSRYEGLLCRWINQGDPENDLQVSNNAYQGPGTADTTGTAPSQVAGLIRKRTGRVGRKAYGRVYVPFPPKGAEDPSDLITAAYRTVLISLAGQLQQTLTVPLDEGDTDFEPGIVTGRLLTSFKHWADYSVGVGFATQRRRGYFGRPNVVPIL